MQDNSRVRNIPGTIVKRVLSPFENFAALEASSGILLLVITAVALVWANSPWYELYHHLIETPISFGFGTQTVSKSFHHWVNDGLMVIFFFVVGLEIKRELVLGELSSVKKAALPMVAALGGMVVPALIYHFFNHDGSGVAGWGIPMATDIAFAVGVLTLFSRKIPVSLKIFLLALAIVDDLGAVIVIALFYTEQIVMSALGFAVVGILVTVFLQLANVRKVWIYWLLGIFIWIQVLQSGVHATIAGVALGLLTPVTPFYNLKEAAEKFRALAESLKTKLHFNNPDAHTHINHDLQEINNLSEESRSPLDRMVHSLHPWVSFGIMPVFAFVNAGVHLNADLELVEFFNHPVALGVILGLFLGKPIGILLSSFVACKLGWAQLPQGVTWKHMICVGFLAGIGFTMALFVSHLALKVPDAEMYSKLGILVGSLFSATVGIILLATGKDAKPS